MPRDYYEVLGVRRDADEAEIKKSFRRLARELHPDVNQHDPDAEEKFKEAAEAYEVLSDSQRRATYDRYGHEGLRTGGYAPNFESFGSVADIFEAFFGNAFGGAFGGGMRQAGPAQGADVAVQRPRSSSPPPPRGTHGRRRLRGGDAVRALPRQRRRAGHADRDVPALRRHRASCAPSPARRSGRSCARRPATSAGATAASRRNPCRDLRRARAPGRARQAVGRRPGRDRLRAADPRRRPRPCRRARRASRRPLRADRGRATIRASCVTAMTCSRRSTSPRRWPRSARRSRCRRSTAPVELEIPAGTQPHETLVVRGRGMPSLRGRRPGDLRVVINVVIPRQLKREQRELMAKLADSLTAREPAAAKTACSHKLQAGIRGRAHRDAARSERLMIRLAVRVAREHAEIVLAELLELAPSGVEEVDIDADTVEYAVYGAPGELPELPDLRAAAGAALVEVATTEIADDWAERWREFHRPLVLGERLTVRPPWEPRGRDGARPRDRPGPGVRDGRACDNADVPRAAPGAAGPGRRGRRLARRRALVDLGCGSGVLAIAAAKLGWDPVLALDFDPLSVEATGDQRVRQRRGAHDRSAALRSARGARPGGARSCSPTCLRRCCEAGARSSRPAPRDPDGDRQRAAHGRGGRDRRARSARSGCRRGHACSRGEWAALLLSAPG